MSYQDLFDLNGKVALVVGAAGGLAEETCIGLAQFGATLALADISEENLEAVCNSLKEKGIEAWSHGVDVAEIDSVKGLTQAIHERFGRLDILVNFAGIGWRTPLEEIDVAEFQNMININLMGSFLLTQLSMPFMRSQGSGKIILVGSVSGQIGRPYVAHYASSKGGVHSLVRAVAVEMAQNNIQVNSVAPVFTMTKMTTEILSDPEVMSSITSTIPMGRLGLPSDLVGAIVFLSSRASDFITGHTIFVDGGCTIS